MQLLNDISANQFDIVVVWKSSRLFRNGLLAYRVKEALVTGNCEVASITDGLNRYTLGIYALFGEMEWENIRSQTMMGKMGNAKRGEFPGGKAPFGYTIARLTEGARQGVRVIPDPAESEIVHRIFELAAAAWSSHKIAHHLDAIGSKPRFGEYWHHTVILTILKKEAYYSGKMEVFRERTRREGKAPMFIDIPPLVESDLWNAANQRRLRPSPVKETRRDLKLEALLRGRLTCSCCEATFLARWHHKRRKLASGMTKEYSYPYYRCHTVTATTRERRKECSNTTTLRVDTLDNQLWTAILNALADRSVLREYIENYSEQAQNDRDQVQELLTGAKKHHDGLIKQREGLAQALLNDGDPLHLMFTPVELRDRAERVGSDLRSAETEIRRLELQLATLPIANIDELLSQIQESVLQLLHSELLVSDDDLVIEAAIQDSEADLVDIVTPPNQEQEFKASDLLPEYVLSRLTAGPGEDLFSLRKQLIERLDIQGIVDSDGSVRFTGVVSLPTLSSSVSSGRVIPITTPDSNVRAVVEAVRG
jgi:hypothetical protein